MGLQRGRCLGSALVGLDVSPLHQDDCEQEGYAEDEPSCAERRLNINPCHGVAPLNRPNIDATYGALQLRWLGDAHRQYAIAELRVDLLLAGLKGQP